MVIRAFPPVETADEDGLLAIGGDVDFESLLLAYRSGIFPWPFNEEILAWFSPPKRAVLFLDRVHIPKSLAKERKRTEWRFATNEDFRSVISACSRSKRPGQKGTWITPQIIEAYCILHERGYAKSVECYDGEKLVGGLYGITIGKMFAGESMFYKSPNASKLSLIYLIEELKKEGIKWIDCQQLTPTLKTFGAELIEREIFLKLLRESIEN